MTYAMIIHTKEKCLGIILGQGFATLNVSSLAQALNAYLIFVWIFTIRIDLQKISIFAIYHGCIET